MCGITKVPLRVPLLARSVSKRSGRSVGCVMGITDQLLYQPILPTRVTARLTNSRTLTAAYAGGGGQRGRTVVAHCPVVAHQLCVQMVRVYSGRVKEACP